MAKQKSAKSSNGANVGYEAQLWQMADALRGSMDAAEYKHVVLGLIFLKYISDAFEEQHAKLESEKAQGADPEDPDEYRALSIFWVPPEARWSYLKSQAKQPKIGELVDDAMSGIERDNPSLKSVLPKDYARPGLDKQRLGQLIDLISNIDFRSDQPSSPAPLPVGEGGQRPGEGRDKRKSFDLLGRIYEYFLSQFASAEGKKGGEFYTPRSVVKLLVEMIEPYNGRVYDPCCGSSGMFVQSIEFIHAHKSGNGNGGKAKSDISIYGQESNYTTWRLAKMNLAIRGIDGQIAHGDTFHNDRHPDLKADFILANPPFNVSDRRGEVLFIDARRLGHLVDRIHREVTDSEVNRIAGMYHLWRGEKSVHPGHVEGRTDYVDIPGFGKSVTLDDIRKHGHVLTPGRYVGAEVAADDGEPFEDKMKRLNVTLRQQQAHAAELDAAIAANLKELGYGG